MPTLVWERLVLIVRAVRPMASKRDWTPLRSEAAAAAVLGTLRRTCRCKERRKRTF